MGILSTLAAIGVGAAGVKVFERMKENNPQGFTNYIKEAEIAAKQLYAENAPVVKEKAQAKLEELKAQYPKAASQIEQVVNEVKGSFKAEDADIQEDSENKEE